jgi:4'-phosphopantetheinyl transferase
LKHASPWREVDWLRNNSMAIVDSEDDFEAPPSSHPSLGPKDVHVWKVEIEGEFPRIPLFWSSLSEPERDRANRFYFSPDRDRFVVCRGLLRHFIAEYLHMKPALITFQCKPYGKPYLAGESNESDLRFNISHSHDRALFAFTKDREVGVDIEWIDAKPAEEQIAERFFSPEEVRALRALPPAQQAEAFLLCWTRKEAFVKARGEGLSMPLDQFAVSLEPGQPARFLWIQGDPAETRKWSLRNLNPGPGYAAALVVESEESEVRCWRLLCSLYLKSTDKSCA